MNLSRTIPILALAAILALGAQTLAPPTTAHGWTAILCDHNTGETRTPGSFPGETEYYAWKAAHHARELGQGDQCTKKHEKPPKEHPATQPTPPTTPVQPTATAPAAPTTPPTTPVQPTTAPTVTVPTPVATTVPVAPPQPPTAPVAPPVQGRGEGGSPQRFAYCVYINTGNATTSGWAYRQGSEGDLGPGGLYSGYEAQGLAYRSVDSRFNPLPHWDTKCRTTPAPAPSTPPSVPRLAPAVPMVTAPPVVVVPQVPQVPQEGIDTPQCIRQDEETGEMHQGADVCELPATPATMPPVVEPNEPEVPTVVPAVPEAPRDESNPDSPWFNGSTVPGGDRGPGKG